MEGGLSATKLVFIDNSEWQEGKNGGLTGNIWEQLSILGCWGILSNAEEEDKADGGEEGCRRRERWKMQGRKTAENKNLWKETATVRKNVIPQFALEIWGWKDDTHEEEIMKTAVWNDGSDKVKAM